MKHGVPTWLMFVAGLSALFVPLSAVSGTTVVEGGGVAVTLDSTGAVTSVSVTGRELPPGRTAGGVFLRDLSRAAEPHDLLLHESWENGSTGWETYSGGGSISFSRTGQDAWNGSWSILARMDGASSRQAGFYLSEPTSVTPGSTLRLQCHWKATRGYLGTDPGSLALQWGAFQVPPAQVLSGLELVPCDAGGAVQVQRRMHVVTFTGQAPDWKAAGAEWTVPPGVTRVRVAIAAVLDPAYGDEALLVDDIQLFPLEAVPSRLEGRVTAGSGGADVEGSVGAVDLRVGWQSRAGSLEAVVTATATDTASRPLDLVLALPVDATSWEWLDDWDTARTIEEPVAYSMAATADTGGWLPVSIYPYGGIMDSASGLATAVPLDLPVPALIRYDAASKLLEVCWHLALAPEDGHASVTVSARIFSFDPAWGFRSVIKRYHDTWRQQARWFQSPFDSSPFESFHRNNYWGENGARRCAEEEEGRILSMQYTVPDLVVNRVCQGTEVPPDLSGLLAFIQALGEQGSDCDRYYNTEVFNEVSRDATEAPVLKYIGVRPWTNGWVQADFKLTPLAGDGEDGYWTWLSQCHLLPAFDSTANPDPSWDPPVPASTVDGVLLDNFGAHVTGDLDPQHIQTAGSVLTYSPADYHPAVFLPAAYRAHMKRLRALLDTEPPPLRAIVINWKGLGIVNADLPLADLCADETDDFFSGGSQGKGAGRAYAPWFVRYKRSLAYQKLRGTAFAGTGITRQDVEHTLAYALLWGTAARFKDETVFDGISSAQADELARAHNRLVVELQRAGWQPLTKVRSSDAGLLVERYGSPPSPFFLVVTNVSDRTLDGTVRLEPSLGVTAIRTVTERTKGAPVSIGGRAPSWVLGFQKLPPFDSLLLEIVPAPAPPRRPSGRIHPAG